MSNKETKKAPIIVFELQDGRSFRAELFTKTAPVTAEHFLSVVRSGFYSGSCFHRIIPGFMAQAALPPADGSIANVKGEFAQNGFAGNNVKHTKGILSMARAYLPDSGSTSFFICFGDCPWLDGAYAAFGKVIEGMEVVDSFAKLALTYQTGMSELSAPVDPPVIKRVYEEE